MHTVSSFPRQLLFTTLLAVPLTLSACGGQDPDQNKDNTTATTTAKSCTEDEDCKADQECKENKCIAVTNPECRSNEECNNPANECQSATAATCTAGICHYKNEQTGKSCDDNNFCTDNDACDGRGNCQGTTKVCNTPPEADKCSADNKTYTVYDKVGSCDPTNTNGCVYNVQNIAVDNCEVEKLGKKDKGGACNNQEDCASGFFCVTGICCTAACETESTCSDNELTYFTCNAEENPGECISQVKTCDNGCDENGSQCAEYDCENDGDCQSCHSCIDHVCVPKNSGSCGPTSVWSCINGQCCYQGRC